MPQIRSDKIRWLKCRYCGFRIPMPKKLHGTEAFGMSLVAKAHIRAMHPSDQRIRLPLAASKRG